MLTIVYALALLLQGGVLNAPERLLLASLGLLFVLKTWSLLNLDQAEVKAYPKLGLLLYSYLWPGIDPSPFSVRTASDDSKMKWFAQGFPTMCFGIACVLFLSLGFEALSGAEVGIGGILAILLIVHFGFSDILSSLLNLLGFSVPRLFDRPLMSRSLNDFWTHRWNRPFVEMNRLLFRPTLQRFLGPKAVVFGLFFVSGLLHELAISFPVGGGWGGPLLYFLLHGGLMLAERSMGTKSWPRMLGSAWTFFWVLGPLPVLFHEPFRKALVLPLFEQFHAWPPLSTQDAFFAWVLTLAGCGHFLVLCASFQVPGRLNWSEELTRLRPLNRKLLWTYGLYIVGMITTLGILILYLHAEMLAGEKGAVAVLFVTTIFWWGRIIVDGFYFEHSDWPEGPEFVIGHTCLTTLFVTIASICTAVLIRVT